MVSIDSIVRRELFNRQLPIHWYVDFVYSAVHCARELHLDTLKKTSTVKLTVNDYNAVTLPTGFVDWVKVGFQRGEFIIPLSQNKNLNPIYNTNDLDETIPYPSVAETITNVDSLNYIWSNNINEYGESTGKGYGLTISPDSFTVLVDRNEIQMNPDYAQDHIILEYITNGDPTSTSGIVDYYVPEYALATIKAYISWQLKENSKLFSRLEVQNARAEYYNEYRILRGRLNSITKEDILQAGRKRSRQSIKG